jgi:hypothetical protein
MSDIKLPAIDRPNGKTYQPRKIQTVTTGNEDEVTGVVVFGTHDVRFSENEALCHAADYAKENGINLVIDGPGFKDWYGTQIAGTTDEGRPLVVFVTDEVKGRACVRFSAEEIEPTL